MPTKTYRKPTRKEKEERIDLTLRLLSRGVYKGEVKVVLHARYGVGARTAERYLSRAREILRGRTGRSLDEHRLDAFAFYESIIQDPEATTRERLLAQARIDKLLGLEVASVRG
jgi:hypothetical protein